MTQFEFIEKYSKKMDSKTAEKFAKDLMVLLIDTRNLMVIDCAARIEHVSDNNPVFTDSSEYEQGIHRGLCLAYKAVLDK